MIDLFLASYAALWLFMLLNTVLLISTLRTTGLLLNRFPNAGALVLEDQGPRVGEVVPVEAVQLAPHVDYERFLLVFLSTECALCRRVAPAIGALRHRGLARKVLIKGDHAQALALVASIGTDLDGGSDVGETAFEQLGIDMTPFALVLDRSRRVVAKGIVNSLEQLESLLERPAERVVPL